jgi:hypothetical protein
LAHFENQGKTIEDTRKVTGCAPETILLCRYGSIKQKRKGIEFMLCLLLILGDGGDVFL